MAFEIDPFRRSYEDFYNARGTVAYNPAWVSWDTEPMRLAKQLYHNGLRIDPRATPSVVETRDAAMAANNLYNQNKASAVNVYSMEYPVQFYALYLKQGSRPVVPTNTGSVGPAIDVEGIRQYGKQIQTAINGLLAKLP